MASVFPHAVTAVADSRQRWSTKELLATSMATNKVDSAQQQSTSIRDNNGGSTADQQSLLRPRTAAALVQPIRQILYRLAA